MRLLAAALCLIFTAAPARAEEAASTDLIAHAIVVDFKDGTTLEEINAREQAWGIDLEFNSKEEGPLDGIAIAVGVDDVEAVLEKIRQSPLVESAEPLTQVRASFVPNDPDFGKQWNLKMLAMTRAWDTTRGKGVIVAVIDSGIAYEDFGEFTRVPDLLGVKFAPGYDFVNDSTHPNDDQGHGTHVAGTIAQATNNAEGVAGIAFEATLMPVKVLNHFGSGQSADIVDAIRWSVDHGAKVLNLSLGGGFHSRVMSDAVAYARAKGAVVICAAGNTGNGKVEYPAAYPASIAVGAVGPDGQRAPYSSYGEQLDLTAPGGDKRQGDQGGILQNTIDPRDPSKSIYASYQGTSMAAPHVSAVAALLFAAGAKSPDAVEAALFAGAAPPAGQSAWSEQYGHGVINAARSLEALNADAPSPIDLHPLYWAVALLALVLLSLGKRQRPGYLNVLLRPGFLFSLLLSTVGLFFFRWLFGGAAGHAGALMNALSTPLPDWERILFGRGKLANPIFYSALLPSLAALVAIKWKGLRPVIAGLALGFAGFLGYALWARAPGLSYLPFAFLAVPWLAANSLVCLVVARALLQQEQR